MFIGLQPNAELAKGVAALDERGFVITGMGLETSVPGLFAAGDVRAGEHEAGRQRGGRGRQRSAGDSGVLEGPLRESEDH